MRLQPTARAATHPLAVLVVLVVLAAVAIAGLIPAAFAPAVHHPLGPAGCTSNEDCSEGPLHAAAGDFNEDGHVDVATANNLSNSVTVLLGDGTGDLTPAFTARCADAPAAIASGSLGGDEIIDLVVSKELSNSIGVFIGNGDGTFDDEVEYDMGNSPEGIVLADFNDDEILDIATADLFGNSVSVRLGVGDGTFGERLATEVAGGPHWLAPGRLDDDEILDLAVTLYDAIPARLATLIGNGDGTFLNAGTSAAIVSDSPRGVALADFNQDGNLDAAVATESDDTIDVLLDNGDGTFDTKVSYRVGGFPESVAAGDYNGDGILDLASADSFGTLDFDGSVSMLLGRGDGTFENAVSFQVDAGAYGILATDLNGDLQLDLVTSNIDRNNVSVLLNLATPAGTATATRTPEGATATATTAGATPTATPTDTATATEAPATATRTATATDTMATLTATPTAGRACVGDCDGDAAVGINELIRGVRIALGSDAVGGCSAFDRDDDRSVSIAELIAAVAAALQGCPS